MKLAQAAASPVSFKRWWRHLAYMPWLARSYFQATDLDRIEQAIYSAEAGHLGEIMVVIERSLPIDVAYSTDTRQRALDLFSRFKVWDTQYNSGVLLYLNLCERQVELLADRGIHQSVSNEHWQELCTQVTQELQNRRYVDGLIVGVTLIGQTLQQFYASQKPDLGNERSNRPILI